MKKYFLLILAIGLLNGLNSFAQTTADTPKGQPEAMIDLATAEGVKLVNGKWRYSDTRIIEIDFKGPGPDNQPTGAAVKTYDYMPHAGGADFDDSHWQVIDASTLNARRSTGRLCFNWYRIKITIPERIDNFDPTGSTVVFETALDDYAEIWVDGELSRALGQMGGSVISGWNAPNRLVIGRQVKPGQQIQLAVFNLASHYTKSKLPGVGISIGLTRLFWQLREAGLIETADSSVDVLITLMEDAGLEAALSLSQKLRAAGLNVETQLEPRKLAKQMQYAERAGIRFVVMRGSNEAERGMVAVKDMRRYKQFEVEETKLATQLVVEREQWRALPHLGTKA